MRGTAKRPRHALVAGAGIMGIGLTRLMTRNGWRVTVVDPDRDALARHETAVAGGGISRLADWPTSAGCDLVIEAVVENAEVKRQVLQAAERCVPREAPLLTNTSGLTLAELTVGLAAPDRLMIAHFFNPADLIPAVEIVPSPETPPARVERVCEVLRALGKKPVVLRQERSGFISNRIQHAVMRECLALMESGVASPAEIDDVVRWSIGLRMALNGPFLQRDLNGLDTHLRIAEYLYPDLARATEPSAELRRRVADGDLGVKTGRGFYDWTETSASDRAQWERRTLEALIDLVADASPERDSPS